MDEATHAAPRLQALSIHACESVRGCGSGVARRKESGERWGGLKVGWVCQRKGLESGKHSQGAQVLPQQRSWWHKVQSPAKSFCLSFSTTNCTQCKGDKQSSRTQVKPDEQAQRWANAAAAFLQEPAQVGRYGRKAVRKGAELAALWKGGRHHGRNLNPGVSISIRRKSQALIRLGGSRLPSTLLTPCLPQQFFQC